MYIFHKRTVQKRKAYPGESTTKLQSNTMQKDPTKMVRIPKSEPNKNPSNP